MTALRDLASHIAAAGTITPQDIRALRQTMFDDGIVTREEADALFAIERARTAHNDAWSMLFVEALTDYALHQELPRDYLSDDTAAWIQHQVGLRKRPSLDADMALVAQLVEQARDVPPSFAAFALRLAKDAVIYGDGTDGRGRMHKSGCVDEADLALLKRILWGAGLEGQLAISRDEAEALCAIADATTGADNVPEFDDLFAKAIGNYLIGATGRAVPSRADALRWQADLPYKTGVVNVLSEMLRARGVINSALLIDSLQTQSLRQDIRDEHEHRNMVREVEMEVAAIMTPEKAGWLRDHVGKNGVMTGPEKALVRFIARESGAMDPSLKELITKVA